MGIAAKIVSERLGHASVAITLDTYSHVHPALQEEAAHTVASLILGSDRLGAHEKHSRAGRCVAAPAVGRASVYPRSNRCTVSRSFVGPHPEEGVMRLGRRLGAVLVIAAGLWVVLPAVSASAAPITTACAGTGSAPPLP